MADRARLGSVRVRVTALATFAVLVVLVVSAVVLVVLQRRALLDQVEDNLQVDAAELPDALDDVDEAIAELVVSLAWIIPVATVALAALVWFVVGRTLRPVERIRAEVADDRSR